MKPFFILLSFFFIGNLIAQNSTVLPLGDGIYISQRNTKSPVRGIEPIKNNVAILPHGELRGNFFSDKKPFVMVTNNKMRVHGMQEEFCYTINPIDVSKIAEVSFSIDISGRGTLDKKNGPNGEIWHDWIDIFYSLDGERTHLGDGKHTIDGLPASFSHYNINTTDTKDFQIEICMRNTGYDEWFHISKIKVDVKEIEETVFQNSTPSINETIAEPITIQTNTPTLVVFPNPTTNYLEVKNADKYDLNTAILLNAAGKMIQLNGNYPFDLSQLPAGTYFLKMIEKATNKEISSSIIVTRH